MSSKQGATNLIRQLRPVVRARIERILLLRRGQARGRDIQQDVEDLVQHVFLRLFANDGRILRQWNPSRGCSLLNYVGLIAEHEVISILRSRRKNPWTEDPTLYEELDSHEREGMSPELETSSRQMLQAVLHRLRQQLNHRGLILFQMLIIEQLPVEDICSHFDMSRGAVYSWKTRLGQLLQAIAKELVCDKLKHPRKQCTSPARFNTSSPLTR